MHRVSTSHAENCRASIRLYRRSVEVTVTAGKIVGKMWVEVRLHIPPRRAGHFPPPGYAALKLALGSPRYPLSQQTASVLIALLDRTPPIQLSAQKLPTNLAQLSVKGARPLAIAQCVSAHGVNAREFVDASLVDSGIGDADTGIVGVCLCWWNAEGCQCYHRCRRRAH